MLVSRAFVHRGLVSLTYYKSATRTRSKKKKKKETKKKEKAMDLAGLLSQWSWVKCANRQATGHLTVASSPP